MRQLTAFVDANEKATRDLLEERYLSLRSQVPIVYLVVLVGLFGLQITTAGTLALGFNLPTGALVLALVRITTWRRSGPHLSHTQMRRQLHQTAWLVVGLCLGVLIWCTELFRAHPSESEAIFLFASLIAVGAAHGLSSMPKIAMLPILVLALPMAVLATISSDAKSIGAASALTMVALLVLRQSRDHSRQFEKLVSTRAAYLLERERAEQSHAEAIRAATTDFLTGLPNRRAFIEVLKDRADRETCKCAVAIVDLDRFKPVNDTLGHSAGDDLLRLIADRLVDGEADRSFVARLGGDEFALVLEDAPSEEAAREWAIGLVESIAKPVTVHERELSISASCGVMLLDGSRPESVRTILSRADIALYHAKDQPEPKVAIFDVATQTPYLRRTEVERALRTALPAEISIVFQPIVDLESGAILAVEALARWRSSTLGDVGPSEFIPAAERLHLIDGLNEQLLRQSLNEVAFLDPTVRLAFNLSAVQLAKPGTAGEILSALSQCDVSAERLQVEVTETALLEDFAVARRNLSQLRRAGILIALDDFGAGYSSISYLREIQFDQIKIDGSFVTTAHQSAERARLLAAVIELCRALRIQPIAEHIETAEQLKTIKSLGCQYGQGFYLCTPQHAHSFYGLSSLRCDRFCRSS